jgi:hypothetical protein
VPVNNHADDLTAAVRHALETTRPTAACPFHWDVIIRVGDDAAESHAFERARKNHQKRWDDVGIGGAQGRIQAPARRGRRWSMSSV